MENNEKLNINDVLSEYLDLNKLETFNISEEFKYKYKNFNFPVEILVELEINTRLRDEYILKNPKFDRDSDELEKFRRFESGFLRKKGIFYCEGVNFANEFKPLQYSTFVHITNGAFTGRYCLPLCLPNGDVFTWMTYDPNSGNKYMIPKAIGRDDLNYYHQGNILGNLESIKEYNSNRIFFCEGLFDAYRINEQFHEPAVAMLGSSLGSYKKKLLDTLKERTRKQFVYVPDFDEAGLVNELIEYKLWDDIFNYSKEYNTKAKDIDQYFRFLGEE